MKVIQIAGYKNSGKTTLVRHLITALRKEGFFTGSLKHHGHGGKPAGLSNKDSEIHHESGAMVYGVEGEGILQIAKEKDWELSQIVKLYKSVGVEILVIEGFKKEHYPKIVMIRNKNDLSLLEQLTEIKAVVSHIALQERSFSYPLFSAKAVSRWYMEELRREIIQ